MPELVVSLGFSKPSRRPEGHLFQAVGNLHESEGLFFQPLCVFAFSGNVQVVVAGGASFNVGGDEP